MSELKVVSAPSQELAMTNHAFVHPDTLGALGGGGSGPVHLSIGPVVLLAQALPSLEPGQLALNGIQRRSVRCGLNDAVAVAPWEVPRGRIAGEISINVDYVVKSRSNPGVIKVRAGEQALV
jgi:hypothetical protein